MPDYTPAEWEALKQHLNSVSRAELEAYVINFLPRAEFGKLQPTVPLLDEQQAEELRQRLRLKAEDLSLAYLYDEDFMNQAFEELRPYAVHNPQLVIRIAKDIIKQLDEALQQGCLYEFDDPEYVGFTLSDETMFLMNICFAQKEPQSTALLIELLELYHQLQFAEDMDFSFPSALAQRVWPGHDRSEGKLQQILQPSVFELLPVNIQRRIVEDNFKRIPPAQQLDLFSRFYQINVHIALLLAEQKLENGQLTTAIQTLDHFWDLHATPPKVLPKPSTDTRLSSAWYHLRHRISEAAQDEQTAWTVITAYIYHFKVEGFQFALSIYPDKQLELESILRESLYGYQYIGYLEQQHRIDEVVALAKDQNANLMPGERERIYTSYPTHFRKEALYCWYKSLDGQPSGTSKQYYSLLIQTLEKIAAYEEPKKFKALVQHYRDNFKRNTRLLRMLELKGW